MRKCYKCGGSLDKEADYVDKETIYYDVCPNCIDKINHDIKMLQDGINALKEIEYEIYKSNQKGEVMDLNIEKEATIDTLIDILERMR